MADTSTTLVYDKWAKEVYPAGSDYWKQFNQATPALDLIHSSNELPVFAKAEGRYIVVPVQSAPGANDGMPYGESSGLATASMETVDRLKYNVAMHNSAIKITGLSMATMKGGDTSVQDNLVRLMEDRPKSFRSTMNYFVHRNGSGKLANVVSCTGSTITLDDATPCPINRDIVVRQKSYPGSLSGAGQTAGYALTVTACNLSTNVITVQREDGTAVSLSGMTTTDGVYPFDSQGQAINGFEVMCDTANPLDYGSSTAYYGTVDRSANTWWQGNKLYADTLGTGAGTSQDFDLFRDLQTAIDRTRRRAREFLTSGSTVDGNGADMSVQWYAFTGTQNFRALGNQMKRDQRTAGPGEMVLKGGWRGIDYEGCVFVVDQDAPPSTVRAIHFPSARRYDLTPPYWQDETGAIFNRVNASNGRNGDIFKAYMVTRTQFLSVQSLSHFSINNLNATY